MTTDLRARLTDAMAVDRPAPTPTPAPGLDLDAVAVTGCVALADECERLRCTVSALDLKVSDAMAAIATERRRREAVEIERDGAALDRRRHFALYTREHEINATLTTRIATLEAELAPCWDAANRLWVWGTAAHDPRPCAWPRPFAKGADR